jgi:hypothetical protein
MNLLLKLSVELIDADANYETVQYPCYPKCPEYHHNSSQVYCSRMALRNIPNNEIKYKSVVELLQLADSVNFGIGARCGRLHWVYTHANVFQGGTWYTLLLTDSCMDRLV